MSKNEKKTHKSAQLYHLLSLPDLHKIQVARRRGALQLKAGEVQHNLHVDLYSDLEDTVSVVGIVVWVVW